MLDRPTTVPVLQRAEGEGRVTVKARGEKTVLDTLYQRGSAKIRLPKTHGSWREAVLINSSGGLTGGDRLAWSAEAAPSTHLVLTTQACERIYRSAGGAALVETRLSVGAGARLDWLPQETILFDGSALERELVVNLDEGSTFLGLEAVILGRPAHGDRARNAAIRDRWTVRREGRLIHAEALRLDPGDAPGRDNPALLAGAGAYATLLYIAPDAEAHLGRLKRIVAKHEKAGVSMIGDKIVLRALSESGHHLRRIVTSAVEALSLGGAAPKLWSL